MFGITKFVGMLRSQIYVEKLHFLQNEMNSISFYRQRMELRPQNVKATKFNTKTTRNICDRFTLLCSNCKNICAYKQFYVADCSCCSLTVKSIICWCCVHCQEIKSFWYERIQPILQSIFSYSILLLIAFPSLSQFFILVFFCAHPHLQEMYTHALECQQFKR